MDDDNSAIQLKGLDSNKKYRLKEINIPEGEKSKASESGEVVSGDYLMNVGTNPAILGAVKSAVIQLTAE